MHPSVQRRDQVVIGRLRWRGVAPRAQAEPMLASALTLPSSMGAAEILCVRRLRSELPFTPLTASLDRLRRQAARPFLGSVPSNANAVVFADWAELLACLARDWLHHATGNWWWTTLFPKLNTLPDVVPIWREAPQSVPAALAALCACGEGIAFTQALPIEAAKVLLRETLETHGLAPLARALESIAPPETVVGNAPTIAPAPAVVSPWLPWVPEEGAAADLTVECRQFLGAVLLLHRAPQVMRRSTFAADVMRVARLSTPSVKVSPSSLAATPSAGRGAPMSGEMTVGPEHAPDREQRRTPDVELAHPSDAIWVREDAATSDRRPPPVNHGQSRVDLDSFTEMSAAVTRTELGGLFYLINLGLFLELYGDFTCPARPGIALPIWDFIFLVGRRLLPTECTEDPVWALLTRLAGHEADTPAGQGFEPEAWRVPADWLRPFPTTDSWSWNADQERLRVRHPVGFCVIDVPRTSAEPSGQLAEEMAAYALPAAPAVMRDADWNEADQEFLERWLAHLCGYVRPRLAAALGVPEADAGALLLAHTARVEMTAARLDITLALADLPCAIRLAGLDRDPGWMPAAGRSVAFHFA